MEEKKVKKVSLLTVLLIIAVIAIIVMGGFIYKLNKDKTDEIQKSNELQLKISSLNTTINELQGKLDNIQKILESSKAESEKSNQANATPQPVNRPTPTTHKEPTPTPKNTETTNNSNKSISDTNKDNTETTSNSSNNIADSNKDNSEKSKYTNNLADAINGKTAFWELESKGEFQTEKKDGYYTYIDPFQVKYNIKEIKDVSSKEGMLSYNKFVALYEVTVTYLDNNNSTQTMELAISLNINNESNCRGTYINYTGSTSFVRAFSRPDEYTNSSYNY